MHYRILPGITTTDLSKLEENVDSLARLHIPEIALFPTTLELPERSALYKYLEKHDVIIPHIHARADMEDAEFEYLINRFKTQVFNTHGSNENHALENRSSKFRKQIFVESPVSNIFLDSDMENFGGICYDFSHLEENRRNWPICYNNQISFSERYPIGCCHISAVRGAHSYHRLDTMADIQYMQLYTAYLPPLLSLELENTLTEQLEIKKHLSKLLQNTD